MDARQLRYFLAVVDAGSVTRAAQKLLVAQPSLSQTIKGLERELGVSLFHRVGRTMLLSETGQELEGPARLVLRDLEAAQAHIRGLRGLHAGRVTLAAMPSPGIEPLTSLVAQFQRSHPQISVDIGGTFTLEETVREVQKGRAELGLLGGREPFAGQDLTVVHLGEQPLMLAANPLDPPHRDAQGVVPRSSLHGTRFIASHPGSLMRSFVDDLIARGIELSIAAEVAHRTSILPLVLAGVGHAVLPSAWQGIASSSGLTLLPIEEAPSLHISIIARKSGLTPAASALVDLAADTSTGDPAPNHLGL